MDRLFVYGTLRQTASNAYRMQSAEFIGHATVKGTLYQVDWYPALVLSAHGDESACVVGDVYRVSETLLEELDAYEGSEYERVLVSVLMDDQSSMSVWAYQYIEPIDGLRLISSGDWLHQDA